MCGSGSCGGSGGCGSGMVSPLVINPIVSNPDLAGKYSFETKVKKSLNGGSTENVYTGSVSTTGTSADKTLAFQQSLVPVVGNLIRALVSNTYTDPSTPLTAGNMATLTTFRTYFVPSPSVPLTADQAKMYHIIDNLYQVFRTGGSHAGADPASAAGADPCASAGGRLFVAEVATCLFCAKLIMA